MKSLPAHIALLSPSFSLPFSRAPLSRSFPSSLSLSLSLSHLSLSFSPSLEIRTLHQLGERNDHHHALHRRPRRLRALRGKQIVPRPRPHHDLHRSAARVVGDLRLAVQGELDFALGAAGGAVAAELEVAVGGDEGEDTVPLVPVVPYARVEGAVVDEGGILEGHGEVGDA